MSLERIDWSPCKESKSGVYPAPPSTVEVVKGGDGGLTLDQVKAQNRLIALVAKRDAERPDRHWGRR